MVSSTNLSIPHVMSSTRSPRCNASSVSVSTTAPPTQPEESNSAWVSTTSCTQWPNGRQAQAPPPITHAASVSSSAPIHPNTCTSTPLPLSSKCSCSATDSTTTSTHRTRSGAGIGLVASLFSTRAATHPRIVHRTARRNTRLRVGCQGCRERGGLTRETQRPCCRRPPLRSLNVPPDVAGTYSNARCSSAPA